MRLLWRLLKPDGLKTIRVHRHGSSEGRLLGWKLLKYWLRLRQRPSKWIESCGELVETIEEWREERACNKNQRNPINIFVVISFIVSLFGFEEQFYAPYIFVVAFPYSKVKHTHTQMYILHTKLYVNGM